MPRAVGITKGNRGLGLSLPSWLSEEASSANTLIRLLAYRTAKSISTFYCLTATFLLF
jgi:hypothetical protein